MMKRERSKDQDVWASLSRCCFVSMMSQLLSGVLTLTSNAACN